SCLSPYHAKFSPKHTFKNMLWGLPLPHRRDMAGLIHISGHSHSSAIPAYALPLSIGYAPGRRSGQ
ncbi:hypothetical protein AB4454_18615, partial [Vibrio artabrorum]|uniref:hypothetical protein n=1 Tax=Vibrio artabrorum TaxID=446374 RepID=UPI00354CA488